MVIRIYRAKHLLEIKYILLEDFMSSFLQSFYNASVPVSVQATFPYTFAVSKFLQVSLRNLILYFETTQY